MSNYTNFFYVLRPQGQALPAACVERPIGEGVNRMVMDNGDILDKDAFREPAEWAAIFSAGLTVLMADDAHALLPQEE